MRIKFQIVPGIVDDSERGGLLPSLYRQEYKRRFSVRFETSVLSGFESFVVPRKIFAIGRGAHRGTQKIFPSGIAQICEIRIRGLYSGTYRIEAYHFRPGLLGFVVSVGFSRLGVATKRK